MGVSPVTEQTMLGGYPVEALRTELLHWFAEEARDLPWRSTPTLYGTWISEIMLQQTTVAVVIPYWHKFMARFPTVKHLAAAPESEVLSLWSGLGYYRRARNLHTAAQRVMDESGGKLPYSFHTWKSLPGVGDYAAGAISSLGLGEHVPALDVNAKRVIARLLVDDLSVLPHLKPRLMHTLGSKLVDPGQPGSWNEAIMELGATHCSAKKPNCKKCPIARFCRSLANGLTEEIPPPVVRPAVRKVVMAQWFLVTDSGIVVLAPGTPPLECSDIPGEVIRNDFSTLHNGLWVIPQTPWFADKPDLTTGLFQRQFSDKFLGSDCGIRASRNLVTMAGGVFYHGITHHRIRVENLILDLRRIDEFLIVDWLKRCQMAPWGPRNPENSGFTRGLSFLSVDGIKTPSIPVSKMIDKGILLVKKTIG